MKFIDIDLTQAIIDEALNEAVAPVAPDPGLREAIAKVMFQHTTAFTGERGPCYLDEFVLVADAVLAVLAERGVR